MTGFEIIEVQPGNPATLLVLKGETGTIFNSDNIKTITMGGHKTIQPGDPDTVPFGPGQGFSFDGNQTVYATVSKTSNPVQVVKMPGVINVGESTTGPTATQNYTFGTEIGLGVTADLIGGTGFPNPNNLPIKLTSALISSGAVGSPSALFIVEDQIVDTNGVLYLPCEIGMSMGNPPAFNTASLKYDNTIVPAGAKLRLINGGAGGVSGVSRRCSAVVCFYLIG